MTAKAEPSAKGRKYCACGCKSKLPELSLKEKDPFASAECVKKFFGVVFAGDTTAHFIPTPTKETKRRLGQTAIVNA